MAILTCTRGRKQAKPTVGQKSQIMTPNRPQLAGLLYSAPLPTRSRLAPGSVSAATATRRRDGDRTLWILQNQATNHSLATRSWKTNRDRALPIIAIIATGLDRRHNLPGGCRARLRSERTTMRASSGSSSNQAATTMPEMFAPAYVCSRISRRSGKDGCARRFRRA